MALVEITSHSTEVRGLPVWVAPVRIAGVILGVFFVLCAFAVHLVGSDAGPPPSWTSVWMRRILLIIAALPLLVRWRDIRSRPLGRLLLIVLAAVLFLAIWNFAASLAWAFESGESGQTVVLGVTRFCIVLTLCVQFIAIERLHRESC